MKLGIDQLEKYSSVLSGKRLGLLTNNTGISSNYESTIDLLHKNFNLVKLFAPEHGVRGNLQAGVTLEGYVDEKTNIPVVSLYGKNRRPTPEVIEDIDAFVFDIQEVGSRFYTYLYSMAYCMEAAAQNGKEFIVFDRPNPLNCEVVEGNILDLSCKSFIGLYPIPQRYGLTLAESAQLYNKEYGINCNLIVIPMDGYKRTMYFEETGAPYVVPSPNLPTVDSCFTFNATCIFEGTNVSEGRGTAKPFSFVGAPWINGSKLTEKLNSLNLPGIKFRQHYFTPMPYHPSHGKYANEMCDGVELHVTNRDTYRGVATAIHMLYTIRDMFPEFKYNNPYVGGGKAMIDLNTGNTYVREGNMSAEEIIALYAKESAEFITIKSKYHLYS